MSNYPSAIDTFNVIGTANFMDEAGYVLHEHLNQHGSAVNKIQTVMGTNSGTSVLKDFTAGEFAVARNASNVLRDSLAGGTINNAILGSPTITGGTHSTGVINNVTMGTPAITGGTITNPVINSATMGTPTITTLIVKTAYNLGNMGTAKTINWANGDLQEGTLNENVTITHSGASAGQRLTLFLPQDGTGTNTIAWADSTTWQDGITWGTAYYTTTANKMNAVVIYYNGSAYFGMVSKFA